MGQQIFTERSGVPGTTLVLTFRSAGVAQVREASRIAIDGSGRLILYHGARPGECLILSRIRELRIRPVPAAQRPPAPVRDPWRDAAGFPDAELPN